MRYVVVVGAGRLGRVVATRLSAAGIAVLVIDRSEVALNRLPPAFSGFRLRADASRLATLEEAGLSRADHVLALTDDDDVNLYVTQAARHLFDTPTVRARVHDPTRIANYEALGVEVVDETDLAARALLEQP